jgi:hypothetical protein
MPIIINPINMEWPLEIPLTPFLCLRTVVERFMNKRVVPGISVTELRFLVCGELILVDYALEAPHGTFPIVELDFDLLDGNTIDVFHEHGGPETMHAWEVFNTPMGALKHYRTQAAQSRCVRYAAKATAECGLAWTGEIGRRAATEPSVQNAQELHEFRHAKRRVVEIHDADTGSVAFESHMGVAHNMPHAARPARAPASVPTETALRQIERAKEERDDQEELAGQLVVSENIKMTAIDKLKRLAAAHGASTTEIDEAAKP